MLLWICHQEVRKKPWKICSTLCLLRHVTLRPDLELVDEIKLDEDSEAETKNAVGNATSVIRQKW